jgi:Mg2+-importing ATPase
MLVFGPLSSLFDFATFAVLLWGLRASETVFHTGWFIESILSAGLVVFTVRTRQPLGKSHPGRAMMLVTALTAAAALLLPYTPLAAPLGLAPLPFTTLLVLLGIVVLYFFSAELTKRWFYRRIKDG